MVAIPYCDADLVGAIAEYRHDLFAIANDRKLKLRPSVVEQAAHRGMTNWQVPARPEQRERGNLDNPVVTATGRTSVECYCNSSYQEILSDLKEGALPDDALVLGCCWRTICRVRGLYFNLVDPQVWTEICRRRGYIQQRENPRGF